MVSTREPTYAVIDDPNSAVENEVIVTIFDWHGQAPVRATVGWNAHFRRKVGDVGSDEGAERDVESALAQAQRLVERYGFQCVVIVLEHDDLWKPQWGTLVRREIETSADQPSTD